MNDDFVLPATVQNFNLTFDLSWKVLKELALHEFGVADCNKDLKLSVFV